MINQSSSEVIEDALTQHPEVAMVTGLVTAYTYLDSEGVPSWGMVIPKDQRIIETNAIVDVARRVTSQWVDEMLFEDNN